MFKSLSHWKQVHAKACNEDKSVCKKGFHYMSPPLAIAKDQRNKKQSELNQNQEIGDET